MKLTLNAKELADALGLSESLVNQYASKDPDKLPPRVDAGLRRNIWSIEVVQAWLREKSKRVEGSHLKA